MPLTLEELLAPHAPQAFLGEIMGVSALYVEGSREKLRELLDWGAVNRLLEYGGLIAPRLRLFRGDEELSESLYSRTGANGYSHFLVTEFYSALRNGGTLAIDSFESLHEPVSRLCQELEHTLEVPVQADLYATWPNGPDCEPGWNDHEAIVLHIEGTKGWSLHRPTVPHPVATTRVADPRDEPAWTGVLTPGGVLYIPRGWWFSDQPAEEPALYLVVTFRNPTGLDVIRRLVARLAENDHMRMDFPRFGSREKQSLFLNLIQAELARECATPGLLVGFLKDARASADTRVSIDLPDGATDDFIPRDDLLVIPLIRFPRADTVNYKAREDAVEIMVNGNAVRFHTDVARIFQFLYAAPAISVGELSRKCGDEIPKDRFLNALSELRNHGVVSIAKAWTAGLRTA